MGRKQWKADFEKALNRRAWERLEIEEPVLASDLEAAVSKGATPEDVYRVVLRHGSSRQMALWQRNATAHLQEEQGN